VKTAVADRVLDSSVRYPLARKRVPAMDTNPRDHSGSDATQEVANLGMVRPPLVYGASIVTGLLLEFGWPLPFLPRLLAALLGSVLVVVAVIVFSYSIRTFRTAGTPVPGNKPTTVIVRTGPYRFSRNPIYLAFSIFQLGIASWVNSVWLIATLIAAVGLMAFVVIPREERYLERRFGADYLDYKRSVRRWL
jgi:protein-S-isoprenylcysteine O-methyltransferase Ste14